ncbi:hypothetical protein F5Y11DRAFT_310869 [Daldinia sp. FL1419]|nr:hypothetical protein F5Y11DRAFT_310869 [Daldinia sp. FL1419]
MAKYTYSPAGSTLAPSFRDRSPPPPYPASGSGSGSGSSSRSSGRHTPSERTSLLAIWKNADPGDIYPSAPPRSSTSGSFVIASIVAFFTLVVGLSCYFALTRTQARDSFLGPPPVHSIAIIGAGPAGISAAEHLYQRAKDRGIYINITIFESAPIIGGQLALNSSTGGPVFPYDDIAQDPIIAEDIAGTALLWGNPLFTKTSEKTLGDHVEIAESGSQLASYFMGSGIIAQTTRPYSKTPTTDWMGLIFRYGSSVWSAGAMAKQGAELQDLLPNAPLVPDISQLLISMGIVDYARKTTSNELNDRGIGGAYVPEILAPEVSRTYAQQVGDMSALSLMLASGIEDTATAYVGGEFLERADLVVGAIGADVRESTEVRGIKYAQIDEHDFSWLVHYSIPATPDRFVAEPFEKVILAAPRLDLYQGIAAEDVAAVSALTYRDAYIAFFTVSRRIGKYGGEAINQVMFTENALGPIREIMFVRDVNRIAEDGSSTVEYLYRAVSDEDSVEQLEHLDVGITWIYQKKLENAYPSTFPANRFPPFKLSNNGLWWTSAIHTLASTIDLSCLAGKVVAEQLISEIRR